ncbi:EAL domain-containing protein [Halobacillus fulvus]|nr:EAL domain-containing protein [Halobacillus fulvus]
MEVFVARQPILDKREHVFGYELLYRNSRENRYVPTVDGNRATTEVLRNSFLTIGLDRLSQNKPCFINFTEDLLFGKVAEYFDPRQLIVEILEDVTFSIDLIRVCRGLKEKGFSIALDDVICVNQPSLYELLPYIDILKVDIQAASVQSRKEIIYLANQHNITLLAEKVETHEEHRRSVLEGFDLFQGFYFSKPDIVSGIDIPVFQTSYVQMMKELSLPYDEINIDRLTEVLEQDLSLTYKLLRLINTSVHKGMVPIQSIKQAVMLVGTEALKKWVYVLSIEESSPVQMDVNPIITKTSLIRAKMCEQVAVRLRLTGQAAGFFLTGFLSMVDVITKRPMKEIMTSIPLDQEIKQALVGTENVYRDILDLVIAMEKADFDKLDKMLEDAEFKFEELFEIYGQAITWTDQLYQDHFSI